MPEDTLTSHNDLPLLSDVEMEDCSDAVTVQLNSRGKLLQWLKDKQIAFKKFTNSTKINLQFLSRLVCACDNNIPFFTAARLLILMLI